MAKIFRKDFEQFGGIEPSFWHFLPTYCKFPIAKYFEGVHDDQLKQ